MLATLGLGSVFLILAGSAEAATFVVNSTGDAGDAAPGDTFCATAGAVCTLRAAIQEANALAGPDTINFNIGGGGPQTINPASAYPLITTVVTINGTTQPGWAGAPIIEINGAGTPLNTNGLTLSGAGTAGSTIRGLVVNRFPGTGNAIRILAGCSNIVIAGNYIGTDLTGALARPSAVGVFVQNATGNRIGGTVAADRNLISGNSTDGVQIVGAGATGNVVQGNYVGLDAGGTADLGNTNTGVAVFNGATNNTVGGTAAGAGNVISGNNLYGVAMSQAGTTANRVEGNRIGTNAAGTAAVPNTQGVAILSPATGNTIGGTAAGMGNLVSGNGSHGIVVGAGSTLVQGNYVGTNAAGTAAVPNGGDGISVESSSGSTIGGTAVGARNVVSGNTDDGIEITGATATNNVVQGNYVGTNAAGNAPLGNGNDGIVVWLGRNNTIGGTAAGAGNVVGGNQSGMYLGDATATGNSIVGNFIGANPAGTAAIANITGIYLDAASTTVGGTVAGAGNLISGNSWAGLWIAGTSGVVVQGNLVGTVAGGGSPLPNGRGIYLTGGANNNTIGGAAAGAGNVISGNGVHGILIDASSNNTVQANRIGTDASGTADVGNTQHGIQIASGSSNNLIGGAPAVGNVISGNDLNGVDILGAGTTANRVAGNIIGLDVTGTANLGNIAFGVAVAQGASGNVIGEVGGRNVISRNGAGVRIVDAGTNSNLVQLNYIGLDVTGTVPQPNVAQGVILDSGIGAATGNTIGGAGLGNVISGNGGAGVEVRRQMTGTLILGNRIGTNAAGTAGIGNGSHGILLDSATAGHTIGGTAVAARNVISANTGQGIRINGAGSNNNVIAGNFIGTDAAGTGALGNASGGIAITNPAANNTIGGTVAGAGNVIAFNATYGINLASSAGTGNAVLGNSIHGNVAELGIDLVHEPGVTANDLGDVDGGPNNTQNFPLLSAAATNGAGSVHIAGSLHSAASTIYRIEFFASTAADPSGFGEGQRYLGAATATTNASGNAVIGVTLGAVVSAGEFVTATATDPANNTSEFSAAILAYGSLIVTTTADTVDGNVTSVSALIANPGGDGRISLREAIRATNATAGTDTIRFGIPLTDANHLYYRDDTVASSLTNVQVTALADAASPSSPAISDFDPDYPPGLTRSWYRIRPTSALDTITQGVVLDATTQPGAVTGGPVVALDGALAGGGADGLRLTSGPGTVRGLVVHGFGNDGLNLRGAGGFTVTGCYLGTDASGTKAAGNVAGSGIFITNLTGAPSTIGGSTAALRNVVSANGLNGIYVYNYLPPVNTQPVVILGNVIGADVRATTGLGVQTHGIVLEYSGGHTIGGPGVGQGNVISGNAGPGIDINGNVDSSGGGGAPADNNLIEGNRIGTNRNGNAAIPNAGPAIQMYGTLAPSPSASGNTIRGNVIAASTTAGGHGIAVWGNADNNVYDANFIGTDPGGTVDLGNAGSGIHIEAVGAYLPAGNRIQNNVIRFNDLDGVRVLGTGSVATLTQNQISSNDALGIDLGGDGVTPNDLNVNDADTGPNELMNFPSFPPPVETAGTLVVSYGLDHAAGWYRIEFFKNPVGADPSGYGEGQVFASSVVVNHLGGRAAYSHSFAGSTGEVVSATATLCTDGSACAAPASTSEFSRAWAAVTTAVELFSFTAVPGDESVRLEWTTASELDNLGFFLHRSLSETGPWTRITPALIPGLGSSPLGASYSWTDTGLANDTRYFYRLEDVDTASLSTFHGPVSAVPRAASPDGEENPGSDDEGAGDDGSDETRSPDAFETYGDPTDVSLRVLSRTPREAVIELWTGGFYVRRDDEGHVRVSIPGFDDPSDPRAAALPFRRVLLDGVVGRAVSLRAVQVGDRVTFSDLVPAAVGYAEIETDATGTVRPGRRRASWRVDREPLREAARLRGTAFLGESKKVVLEISPLRYDDAGGRLVLARRVRVRVAFEGREARETGSGRVGRRRPRRSEPAGRTLAFLHVSHPGLHALPFESAFAGRTRPLSLSTVALLRQGEAVPFHVEPAADTFGPGGVLYFYATDGPPSTAFSGEVAYELARQTGGAGMASASAAPAGEPVVTPSLARRRSEVNRIYQSGLLEAEDPWLWESVFGGASRTVSFALDGVDPSAPGRLSLFLQGGSDAEGVVDHHLRVLVNGIPVGETRFDGKTPHRARVDLPASVARESENTLTLENMGDTGVQSVVYLDRFEVEFPQVSALRAGLLEGTWLEGGVAAIAQASSAVAVDVSDPLAPVWLRALENGQDAVRLRVEAGHRYLVVSPEGVVSPRVARPARSDLASEENQADYIVITPQAFLAEAQPLLERRQEQGLATRAVSLEEIADVFGHGQSSAEAIRDFLTHAFHSWRRPSPRYVLLLGDASRDPRNFSGRALPAPLPALWARTSYLWTAADPLLAAVNGEDELPDLALGRLPATTLEQARALVAKVLDWEDSGQDLGGAAVLVADNADAAGDFERDVDDIRGSFLADRETTTIRVREEGSLARAAILDAFDRGASLMSYVGHGGSAVWASENVLNSWDAASLAAQSRQPLMLTLNCLNGYFVGPTSDSLAEAFLKVEGRGTIAAFSPSGLSVDGPAHLLHRALMAGITSGRHARLGDAILAAQEVYADAGVMPELLAIYHLFGDPAMRIR